MTPRWSAGNRIELLENGDEFYPRVFREIERARHEVIIETFILGEDRVGEALTQVLVEAVGRGVRVELTVDAWGSRGLSEEFLHALTTGGVCVHLFEEKRPRWLLRVAWFRRLHRKIVTIDGRLAFVGGINFSEDHLSDYGREAKQDYSVSIAGPVAREIRCFARAAIEPAHRHDGAPDVNLGALGPRGAEAGSMRVMFMVRDNRRGHRTTIEKHYRAAIRQARRRLIIANAYFFPGHLLLREIRAAARRGVDVTLIMQAEPDIRIARFGARLLYDYLLQGGVKIYEYRDRQFHGKVALIDDDWVTVGSSNLDPLSLWFNLEANVVVRDDRFNSAVHRRLQALVDGSCREIRRADQPRRVFWRPIAAFFAFHLLRRFPRLTGLLPAHQPQLTKLAASGRGVVRKRAARERSELARR